MSEGPGSIPELLAGLDTPSWLVRREVVAALASRGNEAAEAMCLQLRNDRRSEVRLAALVDALVASSAQVDDLLFELLNDANPAVICDGVQIMGRRRSDQAVPRLVELTSHVDDNVAVASIEALGHIGGNAALACLLTVLASPSFFRSFPAIDVLGRIGDTRAVEPLTALLSDSLRGSEAARALGRLGDETAIPALLRLLAANQVTSNRVAALALADIHDRSLRRYATEAAFERALAPHADKGTLEARLERALRGADATEQRAIGTLLGFFSSSTSIDSLRLLLDEASSVAEAAAGSLARLVRVGSVEAVALFAGASTEQLELLIPKLAGCTAAVPALVTCLRDQDTRVRVLACDALAKTGDTSCAAALFELLGDPDISISQAAGGALTALRTPEIEDLALAAATGAPKGRRQAALRILGHFGSARSLPVLLDAAMNADERDREIALTGLGNVGGEGARRALLDAARHESARTRAAAVRGLGHLDAAPEGLQGLRQAASDPDAWVRYYACQALGNLGDAEATDVLAARAQDSAGQVRVAAIEAIAKLGTPAALEVLAHATSDEDPELRRAALAGISLTRQPTLLPLLLDASYGSEIVTRLVALSGLVTFTDPAALGRVCEVAASDPDGSVQSAAIELLADSAAPAATAALIALLSDPTHQARAVSALTRGAAARTPQLLAALEQAPADVAEALVTVLTTLPATAGEPLLLAALDGSNEHARRAAVRALRFAFDSEATSQALSRAARHDSDPEVRRVAAARLP